MQRLSVQLKDGHTVELLAEQLVYTQRLDDVLELEAEGSATLYVPAEDLVAVIPISDFAG